MTKDKTFFDYQDEEKKEIIKQSAREATEMQGRIYFFKEVFEKNLYDIWRKEVKSGGYVAVSQFFKGQLEKILNDISERIENKIDRQTWTIKNGEYVRTDVKSEVREELSRIKEEYQL